MLGEAKLLLKRVALHSSSHHLACADTVCGSLTNSVCGCVRKKRSAVQAASPSQAAGPLPPQPWGLPPHPASRCYPWWTAATGNCMSRDMKLARHCIAWNAGNFSWKSWKQAVKIKLRFLHSYFLS